MNYEIKSLINKNNRFPEISPIKSNDNNTNILQTPDISKLIQNKGNNKNTNSEYNIINNSNYYINNEKVKNEIEKKNLFDENHKIMEVNSFNFNNETSEINQLKGKYKNKLDKDLLLIHNNQKKQLEELEKRKEEIEKRKKEIIDEKNDSHENIFNKLVKISKSTEKLINESNNILDKIYNINDKENEKSYVSIFDQSKKYTISSKRVRNKTPDINLLNEDNSNNDNIVFNSGGTSIKSSRIYINKKNNKNYNYFKLPLFDEDKVQKKEKYLSKLKEDYKNRKVEEKIKNSLKQQMKIKKKEEMNFINDTIKYKNKSLIQEYLMPPNQIYDIIPPKAHYLYHNKTGF
jgi:hypothetical protein